MINYEIANAITNNFSSTNEIDSNFESPANVVDGLFAIARALNKIAEAIHERDK